MSNDRNLTPRQRGCRTHPAACPYCGGDVVNQCQPLFALRPVRLDADGTIVLGPDDERIGAGAGLTNAGPSLLFCHGCNSTYMQPANVAVVVDVALVVAYPEQPPHPGQAGYVGMGVGWTPAPAGPEVWLRPRGEG